MKYDESVSFLAEISSLEGEEGGAAAGKEKDQNNRSQQFGVGNGNYYQPDIREYQNLIEAIWVKKSFFQRFLFRAGGTKSS